MLKITLHDYASELCFRLEGKLSGPWVEELHQCWLTAASTVKGRRTVLDLGEVDFVDAEGQALLRKMQCEGVRFQAATPLIRSLLEEIRQRSGYGTVEDKTDRSEHAFVHPSTSRSD